MTTQRIAQDLQLLAWQIHAAEKMLAKLKERAQQIARDLQRQQ